MASNGNENNKGNEMSWSGLQPKLQGKSFADYVETLLEKAKVQTMVVAAGAVIFEEGDKGDCAYFVSSGNVKIACLDSNGINRTLALVGPGEIFGEMALLDQSVRSASAIAADSVVLYIIERDEVQQLMHDVPQLSIWMLNVMARRLRRMDRVIAQMVQVHEVNMRILNGQEAERRRVGRDLHDGPAQCFADYIMRLQIIDRLIDRDTDQAKDEIEELQVSLKDGLQKIRDLIYNLHPKELSQSGLTGAIEKFVEKVCQRAGLQVEFEHKDVPEELDPDLEATLYCIVQEAVNNARKHAEAETIRVSVEVDENREMTLVISDDGKGFDVQALMDDYEELESYGLSSMDERILLAGGTMNIQSAVDCGTMLTFKLQLPKKSEKTNSDEEGEA